MLFVRSHKIDIESQLRPMQNISNESEKMCCRWSLIHFLSKKSEEEKTDRIFVCAVSAFDNRFSSQWGLWTHNDHMQYCSKAKAQRKKIRNNLLTLYYRDAVLFYARTYTNTHIHRSTEREIQRERERKTATFTYVLTLTLHRSMNTFRLCYSNIELFCWFEIIFVVSTVICLFVSTSNITTTTATIGRCHRMARGFRFALDILANRPQYHHHCSHIFSANFKNRALITMNL